MLRCELDNFDPEYVPLADIFPWVVNFLISYNRHEIMGFRCSIMCCYFARIEIQQLLRILYRGLENTGITFQRIAA